jgi:hypothetical protein
MVIFDIHSHHRFRRVRRRHGTVGTVLNPSRPLSHAVPTFGNFFSCHTCLYAPHS